MISPKVSIITPAYNCESTIRETIESVICQSYQDWEMIIVDDCSVDSTFSIIREFTRRDSRIKGYQLKRNRGAGPARNFAMDKAQGRYFAFLDSDDFWFSEKLEMQVAFMQENEVYFCYHDYNIVNEDGDHIKRVCCPEYFNFEKYCKNTSIGVLTIMIDVVQTGKPEMMDQPATEAVTGWLKILKCGIEARKMPGVFAFYRISPGSISRNKLRAAFWYWHSLVYGVRMGKVKAALTVCIAAFNAFKKNSKFIRKA